MKFLSQFSSETMIAAGLLFLLFWFINPFDFWMTDMLHMTLLGLIVACSAIFAMFLWREQVTDEREQLHRFISARFAYVMAGAVLLLGTVWQALSHAIDPWLPVVLTVMVLAKIVGRYHAAKFY